MNINRILLIGLCCMGVQNALAGIHKWVDENGRVQYSDRPHPSEQSFNNSHDRAINTMAILEPTANELYLKTAWERILDKTLDRYLKRYEKGALSGVEIAARERALKTIHSTMNSAMSWNTVGEEVMMVIAVECGEKLLDQLTALKFDGTDNPQVATPLFKKYIVCANSGLKKSFPILLNRIKAVGPKIHKIVRQYNPDF